MFDDEIIPVSPDQSAFDFMGELPGVGERFDVAIVGVTGLVGKTLLRLLKVRNFPIKSLHVYASDASSGRWMDSPFGQLYIEKLDTKKPPSHDIVFMAAGSSVARKWGWRLARKAGILVDKSSYFRNKDYAPLIVPEVNPGTIRNHRGIIANPNCTTIPLVTALAPLHKRYQLKSLVVVTFQSVSGAGKDAMIALERELGDPDAPPTVFPHRIAYNAIPWVGGRIGDSSEEEYKLVHETRRILDAPRLSIRATAVRIPTMIGHCLAVHAQFRKSVKVSEVYELMNKAESVTVIDDIENNVYPTPLESSRRGDEVLVGRIRSDRGRHGLAMWVVANNLRKGAATNAVQIVEKAISEGLLRQSD